MTSLCNPEIVKSKFYNKYYLLILLISLFELENRIEQKCVINDYDVKKENMRNGTFDVTLHKCI